MKKLMMIAAALAVTGIAQAASIQWGSSAQNIRTANDSGVILLGAGVVQLIYISGSMSGSGIYAQEAIFDSGLVGDGAVAPKGGKYVDTINYVYGTTLVGGQTLNNGDQFIIRVYDASTVGAAANYWNSGVFTITATNDSGLESFYLATTTTASGTWYPVPEPTSFALLALGAAAVGLRRRLRK